MSLATSQTAASGEVRSRSRGRLPVSVIILTYNEATNIQDCLSHLKWTDDVIVVDSNSDDATLELATNVRPDVRTFVNSFSDFGQQRNWALDNTRPRYHWILFLDADERCTPRLAEAIADAINSAEDKVGFYLTCRNVFLDRWLKRCTLYPSWQLRLLRHGEVRYRKEGHGQRELTDGPLGYIEEPYDHYGFSKGVAAWIDRHNGYSTNEVELIERLRREPLQLRDVFRRDPVLRRRCLKRLAARVGFRPFLRFFYLYIVRRGFLDGLPGFWFCSLRFAHEIHITVKLAEAKRNGLTCGEVRKLAGTLGQTTDDVTEQRVGPNKPR
jgi:glycosyltransferase involved in cell wall biosynthesis